jgi:hypothetical protein
MKVFFASLLATLLCLCSFRVPLGAQSVRDRDVIDVHLHAMHPEEFSNHGPAVRRHWKCGWRNVCVFPPLAKQLVKILPRFAAWQSRMRCLDWDR